MRALIFSTFLFITTAIAATELFFPVFTPPKGWLIADPTKWEEGVLVGVVESTKKLFSPSLSLTVEKIGNIDLRTYIEAVKKHYESDRTNTCRELGYINTTLGKTPLLQVDMENQWGELRVLQAISLHEGYALIQTAVSLKKEFMRVHETFLNTFKTLCVYPSLYTSIDNPEFQNKTEMLFANWNTYRSSQVDAPKTLFSSSFFQEKEWGPFTHYVEKTLKPQGICWQFLALKRIQESLMESEK